MLAKIIDAPLPKLTHKSIPVVIIAAISICFCSLSQSYGQRLNVNDPYLDYLDILTIEGSFSPPHGIFSFSNADHSLYQRIDTLKGHPWADLSLALPKPIIEMGKLRVTPHNPTFRMYWQSLEPGGQHDGPVWQGRGFTNDISGGLFIRYGILSAAFRPHLMFNQNRSFTLSPYQNIAEKSAYAYPLDRIDWPQRFGDGTFWTADWGNSYIRADYRGWAAGISNEQMRWGPARHNAILMDSNAPGFRHFFLGTSNPKDIYIGYLKAKILWGKLHESNYFDSNPTNDERYISGLTLSINPKPVPGLTLGVNRIFYKSIPPEGIPPGDLLKIFESFTKINLTKDTNLGGNDLSDQLVSLFGRWTFPKSGFEIYGEWARTDHSWNWRDFIVEPGHSRGYTIGLEKTFNLDNRQILSVNAELTQLETTRTGEFRPNPPFYVHSFANQGYTNRGQLLGAAIGPGGNSQYIGSSLFFDKGKIKIFAQRATLNNDFLYASDDMLNENLQSPDNPKYLLHNTELRFGASLLYFYKQFETDIGFVYRREMNDDYIYKNDLNHLGINLSLRYHLPKQN
ncbi:capsule assembly Wzi family protein [Fodinibius salsisoli]|uniref:Capsule assembly protein Wzi n=1 Tax=Fodinibius salsisoli TaxID=2820877 RepID=A0ABT3PHV5_9BACT|nr:capsule assembly Wzi family protein [Fodinibius salsisoli]MCW9705338.1 hypothetical protein [Fodinibius salsisoli]